MKKKLLWALIAFISTAPLLAQQENPRGLYKLQKFVYDDGSEKVPPFNQYKYCTDELALQIEMHEDNYSAGFLMSRNDSQPLNYTGNMPVGEDGQGTQIFDSNKEHFTLRWYNVSMPNHSLFPFNSFISEVYSSKKGISPKLTEVIDMLGMKTKVKKPNKLTGVWKRRGITDRVDGKGQLFQATPMYKIYTDNRMLILEGEMENPYTFRMAGHLWTYEAYTDRLLKENNNSCLITWINDNTFSLIWIAESYPVLEIWDRSELPETMQTIFK